MRERLGSAAARAPSRPPIYSIDVVAVTPGGRQLSVLFVRPDEQKARARWELPWEAPRGSDSLSDVARRIVRNTTSRDAAWMEQLGAFSRGGTHPSGADLSIAFVALVAQGSAGEGMASSAWMLPGEVSLQSARQREIMDQALTAIRTRMDYAPVAFRLLPPTFTLGELQQMYELLLGRRLHKASFRRALQAAYLVEPTDEWRSEGRGRPAQLFRYAPRKRKSARRAVRFDRLS